MSIPGSNDVSVKAPATNDSCDTSKGDPDGSPFAFCSGRVLRPPATNDTGDSEFSGSPVPFRKDRVLRVQDLNLARGSSKRRLPAGHKYVSQRARLPANNKQGDSGFRE
jgi:hypothetical protein